MTDQSSTCHLAEGSEHYQCLRNSLWAAPQAHAPPRLSQGIIMNFRLIILLFVIVLVSAFLNDIVFFVNTMFLRSFPINKHNFGSFLFLSCILIFVYPSYVWTCMLLPVFVIKTILWLSFCMTQILAASELSALLKQTTGSYHRGFIWEIWGGAWELAFLTSSQMMLMSCDPQTTLSEPLL